MRPRATRLIRSSTAPKRPELVADEVDWRHEHDGDRLRRDLPEADRDKPGQQKLVGAESEQRDDEEADALVTDVPALAAEGPETVPRVVVRHRDEERAGREQVVVQTRVDE